MRGHWYLVDLLVLLKPVIASALFIHSCIHAGYDTHGTRSARLEVCVVESDTGRYETGLEASHMLQHESMQISFVHHDEWSALHKSAHATLRSKQLTGHVLCGARFM